MLRSRGLSERMASGLGAWGEFRLSKGELIQSVTKSPSDSISFYLRTSLKAAVDKSALLFFQSAQNALVVLQVKMQGFESVGLGPNNFCRYLPIMARHGEVASQSFC